MVIFLRVPGPEPITDQGEIVCGHVSLDMDSSHPLLVIKKIKFNGYTLSVEEKEEDVPLTFENKPSPPP